MVLKTFPTCYSSSKPCNLARNASNLSVYNSCCKPFNLGSHSKHICYFCFRFQLTNTLSVYLKYLFSTFASLLSCEGKMGKSEKS